MFVTCTSTSVPLSVFGSTDARTRWRARIGVYSWPCTPAVNINTGPGFAPLMMLTGSIVPWSPPAAGTWRAPLAAVPGAAETGPIVKGCWANAGAAAAAHSTNAKAHLDIATLHP